VSWKKKLREYKGKNYNYSLRNKLKKQKKITDDFEVMLSTLTLEEIIGLRLELASLYINNKLYNFPIYKSIRYITKEAVLNFALSSTRSMKDAASLLGIREDDLKKEVKKFEIDLTTTNYDVTNSKGGDVR
tara:strand:- start:3399 stop:3791 length:393 start_codon:yes stop_codon:yes gene_type:complete